ncbi:MAG: hypothetical protein VST68_11325 [Nitrospirota bacterium]|nr:hypothetical protein [Nitrospirota bacterium]
MRIPLFLASALILGLVFTSGAIADDDDDDDRRGGRQAFVGLWQAIDSNDGSTQLLSVTCSRRRACDVRLNDTAFQAACEDNQIGNQIGFAQGVESIKRNVLTVNLTLTCTEDMGMQSDPISQENEFVLDRRNGTLTNNNDDNLEFPNVFHRISN